MIDYKQVFTNEQVEIIERFLNDESIRQIASDKYGRTKIKNILLKCAKEYPEMKSEINARLFANKNHKEDGEKELVEVTDNQIANAYNSIKKGETLTSVSTNLKRTKDYIRKRIIDYIGDEKEVEEFLEILKSNQNPTSKSDVLLFLEASNEEKMDVVFEKLNNRRKKSDKKEYSHKLLERKLDRIRKYFMKERNLKIPDEADKLAEQDFWRMLFDTPELLAYSLSNKIKPAIANLDHHQELSKGDVTRIIRDDATILATSITRTNIQLKLLGENDLLDVFVRKPRYFRTSPEMMYALIELHKQERKTTDVFITKSRLKEVYGETAEELTSTYKLKDKYGDDEYFDK